MFCKHDFYFVYMKPFVWMFIKTYEKLREFIIRHKSVTTLVQMEYSAFEEATVPICSFVLKNGKATESGFYFKLSDFKGGMDIQKQKVLEALANKNCGYFYETDQSNFSKIPGSLIAYWLSINAFNSFTLEKISEFISPRIGLVTGDTDRFLRLWYEVSFKRVNWNCKSTEESVCSNFKWFPYQKGGAFRKWYGNNEYIINWYNDGWECKNDNFSGSRVKSHNYNGDFAFRSAITWTKISSGSFACRFVPTGFMFDDAGPICSVKEELNVPCLAILNSGVAAFYLDILSPTMNYLPGHINSIPIHAEILKDERVGKTAHNAISKTKEDWDAYETSWDFKRNPLV